MADIYGTSGNDNLSGGASNDRVFGLEGDDTFTTPFTHTTLLGGAGDDSYYVTQFAYIQEYYDEGIDTIYTTRRDNRQELSPNVENLYYRGTDSRGFLGTGNRLDNRIEGGSYNDTLDGDEGADTLVGMAGDDIYHVDDAGDVVVENADEGTDIVHASSSAYTLAANIENLTYSGPAGWGFTGTGNALDNVITGGSGDDVLDGAGGLDTLIGGDGNDSYYVYDPLSAQVLESAGAGIDTVFTAGHYYELGENVENLTYTGVDGGFYHFVGYGNGLANHIIGGSGEDILEGFGGDDVLDGGLGRDNLNGGDGDDSYHVSEAADEVYETAGQGTDTVHSAISQYYLANNVENLIYAGTDDFLGFGNALANHITGGSGSDLLYGYEGDDVLDGGLGRDTMSGGAGDDTYIVDDAGEVVTEMRGEGADTVESSVSYKLANYVEKLVLTGTADVNATGSSLGNVLIGNSGNNILDGAYGSDSMTGGLGDDIYVVNQAGDTVTERDGEGTDTVRSSTSFTLGDHVEHLVLTGTGSIDGTGNALVNSLTGNQGANVLDGGAGADTMAGGRGDDTYVVDDADDMVTELGAQGSDTVESAISYRLGVNVESLILTGNADIDGTGNSRANGLSGNDGDNVLNGGFGADIMAGGLGDDTYIVNDANDIATEFGGGGIDNVQSSASFTLGAGIEDLKLTGTGNTSGTGNALDNVIGGNTGDNRINGGLGIDTLQGGGGADKFVFDTALGADNVDAILDFSRRADTIELDVSVFGGIGLGALNADAFHIGTAAADAEDRIVYDAGTGQIFYDADGSGDGAAILFATVQAGTGLRADDFVGYAVA